MKTNSIQRFLSNFRKKIRTGEKTLARLQSKSAIQDMAMKILQDTELKLWNLELESYKPDVNIQHPNEEGE